MEMRWVVVDLHHIDVHLINVMFETAAMRIVKKIFYRQRRRARSRNSRRTHKEGVGEVRG